MMVRCLSEGLGLIHLWTCIRLCYLIVALPGHISFINLDIKNVPERLNVLICSLI